MTCGQIVVGGCANSDIGHRGRCTPWSGICRYCGPTVGPCPHSDDYTSRTKLGLDETRERMAGPEHDRPSVINHQSLP